MASLDHARSCDVELPLRIRIKTMLGRPTEPAVQQMIENPELMLPLSSGGTGLSDMYVICQIYANGVPLALATQTSYKSFQKLPVASWDEWLELPVKYSTLPRNATAAFTIYDIRSSRARRVIGGTVVKLFGANGTAQEGEFTLKLAEGATGDAVVFNDQLVGTKTEVSRLEKLEQMKTNGEVPHLPWLDPAARRAVARTKDDELRKSPSMFLKVELPHFDHRILYCEIGNDFSAQSGGYTVMDPEILYADNLVENKHKLLTRSRRRGPHDQDLKPNPATRDILAALTTRPSSDPLTSVEKDLIWRFRFYLSNNKKALTKFLRCIDWKDKAEVKQALEILEKWEKIDVADALELLNKSFTSGEVRAYAVSRLDTADDDELLLYLLQLVQALKFEPLMTDDGSVAEELPVDPGADGAFDGAFDGAVRTPVLPLRLKPQSLAGFMIRRASMNRRLGSFFYWYILVECKDPNKAVKSMYSRVWNEFVLTLETGNPEQQALKHMLKRQRDFLAGLRNVSEEVKSFAGNRVKKIERLKAIFQETPAFRSFEPLALPLDPTVMVTGIKSDAAYVFKSALNPLKITFLTPNRQEYSIIYKNGDDVRQDQLCLNIIMLIDRLLKNENLDLKLTPYGAMATSPEIGMLQFIASEPMAGILGKQGNIQKFLREHNRADDAPYQINKDAMDTYVKSCAGYCVITYLMGVGDRHFDNLMMTTDGHMFHIDFGYILGRDPKPYPPPMKLTKEMVEGMGGQNSEEMKKFRSHCYSAFLIIRKHAKLILNLFSLMVDSSVHDIALDPDKVVLIVQEKFRLDLNDEMAVKHMQGMIDESVSALFAQFVEKLHTWAQYWRK